MSSSSTQTLAFHALFCDQNPFFDPYSQTLEAQDGLDGDESALARELDPETGLEIVPTVAWQLPHTEPALSASARLPAACFDYNASGASRPVGAPPYEWNPDWRVLRDFLYAEGRLSLEAALELVKRTRNVLQKEPNVVNLRPPYILVGDVHGQYYDLLSMFEKIGDPDTTPYLFLGDYVDRGMFGCEIVFLLCALKLNFPNTFYMIRGNHECRLLTAHFTFLREVLKKYRSRRLYDEVMLLFDALPIGVVLEDEESRFLCVHGGLSPDLKTIADLDTKIDRFQEPGKSGALCDVLWSDPLEEDTAQGLSSEDLAEWFEVTFVENGTRGCGYIFGYAAAKSFIDANNLTAIIRAHEVQRAGYGLNKFTKSDGSPLVITVFSAPNYCDFYANKAAVMKISPPNYRSGAEVDAHTRIEFVQFDCVPHPFYLPKLQNGIEYTLPFLAEKLKQIINYLISTRGLGREERDEKAFYDEIEDMMDARRRDLAQSAEEDRKRREEATAAGSEANANAEHATSSANANAKPASVKLPRTQSTRTLGSRPTPPPAEKQFLSVKERIDMLNKDVATKQELVRRLSSVRGDLIQGKILQNKIQAYLKKATSKFQKAKQQDWQNEGIPSDDLSEHS